MEENYAALIHHPVPKVVFHIPPPQATQKTGANPTKTNGRERAGAVNKKCGCRSRERTQWPRTWKEGLNDNACRSAVKIKKSWRNGRGSAQWPKTGCEELKGITCRFTPHPWSLPRGLGYAPWRRAYHICNEKKRRSRYTPSAVTGSIKAQHNPDIISHGM